MTTSAVSKRSNSVPDPSAPVYALLAELLSREVDAGLLELLRVPDVKEILVGVEPELVSLLDAEWICQ